ncbi:MAG: restriction endonuclease subunit S [Planctomycetota bacterium]
MKPEELADALETLADGPPWDTAWLRSLLPELAVRGCLVAQDKEDIEGARNLVESSMSLRLEAAGGKFTRASAPLAEEEIPETERQLAPKSWRVVPLGNIVSVDRGITFPGSAKTKEPEPGRVACLRTTNVQETVEWNDLLYVPDDYVKSDRNWVRAGDLLMSTANSRDLVGKVALVGEPPVNAAFGGFLTALRPLVMLPGFLIAVLRTGHARRLLIGSATQTTNIANISMGRLRPFPLPVPPLAEQHRIVAKVDELMEHAAVVEERHLAATSARVHLRNAALHALTEAEDHEAVETAWSRIEEHFNDLFTEPDDIQPLRQTILRLAVRGRLVAHTVEDDGVHALSRKLSSEITRLVGLGEMRRPKRVTEVRTFGMEVPASWSILPVSAVAEIRLGRQRSPKDHSGPNMCSYLRVANVYEDRIDTADVKQMNFTPAEQELYRVRYGDLLLNEGQSRELVGRPAIFRDEIPGACFQNTLLRVRPLAGIPSEYLLLVFRYHLHAGHFAAAATQTVNIAHLSAGRLAPIGVPLPPIAEQHRIVAKVDELMTLCDTLETSLRRAKETREQFAGSASHALTRPD